MGKWFGNKVKDPPFIKKNAPWLYRASDQIYLDSETKILDWSKYSGEGRSSVRVLGPHRDYSGSIPTVPVSGRVTCRDYTDSVHNSPCDRS